MNDWKKKWRMLTPTNKQLSAALGVRKGMK